VNLKPEARLKKALQSKKFDAGLREAAVEYGRAAVAAGETLAEAARRLGMKPNTLHRWHQRVGKTKAPKRVDFVEVAGEASGEGFEVVWPTGHLIRVGAGDLKIVFMALEATCCPRG
jgi:hypothetical protein